MHDELLGAWEDTYKKGQLTLWRDPNMSPGCRNPSNVFQRAPSPQRNRVSTAPCENFTI